MTRNVTRDQPFAVSLKCVASGDPVPVITWIKDGRPITNSRISVFFTFKLYIDNSELTKLVFELQRSNFKENSGIMYPQKLGPLFSKLFWQETNCIIYLQVQDDGEALSITQSSSSEDSGYYQCNVANSAGSESQVMWVKIVKHANAPDRPYNLTARALSSTEIEVAWMHNGGALAFSLHYQKKGGKKTKCHRFTENEKLGLLHEKVFLKNIYILQLIIIQVESILGDEMQMVVNRSPYILKNLHAYTDYSIYMKAYTSRAGSDHSEKVTVRTLEEGKNCLLVNTELLLTFKIKG